MGYIVGVDLGQRQDYTAISVIDVIAAPIEEQIGEFFPHTVNLTRSDRPAGLHVVHLERLPLNTSYPKIVDLVGQRLASLPGSRLAELVVDATGVGVAALDLLEAAGLEPIAITITGGEGVTREGRRIRVAKRELVTTLLVALQQEILKIAKDLPQSKMLVEEMQHFSYKISSAGNDVYGAWRAGQHDDLVLAVALPVWFALKSSGGAVDQEVVDSYQNYFH